MARSDLPDEALVKAWMNPPEHSVRPDTFVDEAFAILKRERIRHLLVMNEQDELVGVVTDRDLRRPDWTGGDVLSVREMYLLGDELRVHDVMTDDVVTVTPDTLTAEAAALMAERKIDCLPVLDDEGEVVGILTSSDLLAALVYAMDPLAVEAREAEAS
jgi:acetoin utilization protein AcuB